MTWWRIEGMIPFTRHALWKKVQEDEVIASKSASTSTITGTLLSSTPSPSTVETLASDATIPSPGGLLTTPPKDPSAPSLRIPSIPDAVIIVGDYMQSCTPAASGILDMEANIMQNLRENEYAKMIGKRMRTITTEEGNETNMAKRITSRTIFGQVGSATRDEALAIIKTRGGHKGGRCYCWLWQERSSKRQDIKRHHRSRQHRLRDPAKTRAARP